MRRIFQIMQDVQTNQNCKSYCFRYDMTPIKKKKKHGKEKIANN